MQSSNLSVNDASNDEMPQASVMQKCTVHTGPRQNWSFYNSAEAELETSISAMAFKQTSFSHNSSTLCLAFALFLPLC